VFFRTESSYQNALAQSRGFTTYAQERKLTGIGNPITRAMMDRAVATGQSRNVARSQVRSWFRSQDFKGASLPSGARNYTGSHGSRKHNAIKWLIDMGYATSGDEIADDVPY